MWKAFVSPYRSALQVSRNSIRYVYRSRFCFFNSSGTDGIGIFIAMDIILHLIEQAEDLSNRRLDIMGIVNQLLLHRPNAVQTEVELI